MQCPKKIIRKRALPKTTEISSDQTKSIALNAWLATWEHHPAEGHTVAPVGIGKPLKNVSRYAGILEQHMVPQIMFCF